MIAIKEISVKKLGITFFFACLVIFGIYKFDIFFDKNKTHINKVLTCASQARPTPSGVKQASKQDYIKSIENLLVDYTIDNDIKKTVKNFLQKTIKETVNVSNIYDHSGSAGFSGDLIFFIKDNLEKPILVVKFFRKPFDLGGNFIKELAGYQVTSKMNTKNLQLVSAKAIGKCNVSGQDYGLLALSFASGSNMKDLMFKTLSMSKDSHERAVLIPIIQKAFEKLGTGISEFHQAHIEKKAYLYPAIIETARSDFDFVIKQFAKRNSNLNIQKIRSYFEDLVKRIKKVKITRNIIHGDAHLGNFMYAKDTKALSMLDFDSLCSLVDQTGTPLWSASFDFMYILESLVTFKKRGLTEKEFTTFKKAFIKGYGNTPTEVKQEFFCFMSRLKTMLWLLDAEKNFPEMFKNNKLNIVLESCLTDLQNPKGLLKDFI